MHVSTRLYWYAILILSIVVLALSLRTLHHAGPAPVPVERPVPLLPANTTVTDVPKITEKTVAPILVKDPADQKLIAQLLKENAQYKLTVTELTAARGDETSTGTLTPAEPSGPTTVTVQVPAPFDFKDYRLDVQSDGSKVSYTLHQQFEALLASGRAKNGQRISTVNLFELGPGSTRTQIPLQIHEVATDETRPHFMIGLRLHAGAAWDGDKTFLVGASWLQRGRTWDPKDSRWSFLAPAVTGKGFALLPASFNLGTLPHQPTSNIWIGPLVGLGPGGVRSIGGAGHVQF